MLSDLIVRNATPLDIDFIVETIIEADKSGTTICSMCNILIISETEYRKILTEILFKEDVEGQEFSLSGFLIAEFRGESIGALGSWVEAASGVPSHLLLSTLLLHYIGREKIPLILANFRLTKELSFKRDERTVQLEYGYVKKEFRRKGVYTKLMIESIKKNYLPDHSVSKAQGICFKKNIPSLNSAVKLGFHEVESKISENEQLKKIFPYNEKVLVEMNQQRLKEVSNL